MGWGVDDEINFLKVPWKESRSHKVKKWALSAG